MSASSTGWSGAGGLCRGRLASPRPGRRDRRPASVCAPRRASATGRGRFGDARGGPRLRGRGPRQWPGADRGRGPAGGGRGADGRAGGRTAEAYGGAGAQAAYRTGAEQPSLLQLPPAKLGAGALEAGPTPARPAGQGGGVPPPDPTGWHRADPAGCALQGDREDEATASAGPGSGRGARGGRSRAGRGGGSRPAVDRSYSVAGMPVGPFASVAAPAPGPAPAAGRSTAAAPAADANANAGMLLLETESMPLGIGEAPAPASRPRRRRPRHRRQGSAPPPGSGWGPATSADAPARS